MFIALNALADTTLNFSMNGSRMESTPVQGTSPDEQTFEKNSISFFGQSSFAKETLFLSAQTEIINFARQSYTVNQTIFPRIENQGVRSLELRAMQYLYTSNGWRMHGEVAFNTKGYEEKNDAVQFGLLRSEYTIGAVFTKKPSNKGVFKPILLGMLDITEKAQFYLSVRQYFGYDYNATGTTAYILQPISSNISVKILAQNKNYNYSSITPERRYLNENKATIGLVLENKDFNKIEFGLFHDFNIKEIGASLGCSYYFRHNKTNPATQIFDNMEDKYVPKKGGWSKSTVTKEELRAMVIEILEERGFE
jgi:hypothetical protein